MKYGAEVDLGEEGGGVGNEALCPPSPQAAGHASLTAAGGDRCLQTKINSTPPPQPSTRSFSQGATKEAMLSHSRLWGLRSNTLLSVPVAILSTTFHHRKRVSATLVKGLSFYFYSGRRGMYLKNILAFH